MAHRRLQIPAVCALNIIVFGTVFAPAAEPAKEKAVAKHRTDWLKDAQWGVFTHYLTGAKTPAEAWNQQVDKFDVAGLVKQLEAAGARYYVITLGQNSGHFCAPNAAYDRIAGIRPSKCARRDLVADLHAALAPKGIKLLLYLPCQTPNADPRAQKAFGLPEGARDQPLDEAFARKWAEVIHDWSSRYGDRVVGWWFDGGYAHIRFNEAIARIYADAVKRGNPDAIVTFNPGVKLVRHTDVEDYTAGEINEPRNVECAGRWLGTAQWHMLSYLGPSWCASPPRFGNEQVIEMTRGIIESEGVVTWDVPIQPSGLIPEPFAAQFVALRKGLAEPPVAAAPVPPGNLAYRKRAKLLDVTGTKGLDVNSGKHFARLGVDGDPATKAHAGGEWPWTFHVDLGAVHPVSRVVIAFDPKCFATEYKVNLSADGRTWTTVAHIKGAKAGKPEHTFAATPARYVRIQALKPDGPNQEGQQMGILELEIYADSGK
jgi:hypothetical protein